MPGYKTHTRTLRLGADETPPFRGRLLHYQRGCRRVAELAS